MLFELMVRRFTELYLTEAGDCLTIITNDRNVLAQWEQAHLVQRHVIKLEVVREEEDAEDDVP